MALSFVVMFPWCQESQVALKELPQEGNREVSVGSLGRLQGWFYVGGGVGGGTGGDGAGLHVI